MVLRVRGRNELAKAPIEKSISVAENHGRVVAGYRRGTHSAREGER